jgi:hypothetical protein
MENGYRKAGQVGEGYGLNSLEDSVQGLRKLTNLRRTLFLGARPSEM